MPTTTNVTATFDEPVDPGSISFELRGPGNTLVPASVSYDGATRKATLTPNAELQLSTGYTATVSGARDQAGNVMTTPDSWSFTTSGSPPPPPDDGPGGPILVIASPSNPFTRYYAEILRAEGLNEFAVTNLGSVTATMLTAYDVVILGEMTLNASQVTMLTNYVTSGGNLIAMRPDKALAGLLGLTDASGTLSDAYLQVNTSAAPGRGITGQTMQFHGVGGSIHLERRDRRRHALLHGEHARRRIQPSRFELSARAGVRPRRSASILPARSCTRGKGTRPGRARSEMASLRSARTTCSSPDWVDLNKVAIPQADEQQRLLVNLIEHVNIDRKPLPRFWYFPRGEQAVVVMTGDDHGNGGTSGRFDSYLAGSPAGCSVTQWECIRATSYIYTNTPTQ